MEQDKEYFAFISYKSEDVEWATWLQHELEHYHLPASFNGRTDIPQELRPVFRDIDELSAGNLPEQIQQALVNSQNLIVICSPQAAKSPWVNQEVETFISLGRTNRIFPFIVEGNSPLEFFPPALRNLPKDEERLGGDVSKKGRDAAFVKVVAGMLGVGFDSLWNRYEKEKAEEEQKIREQRDNLLRLQSRFLAEKANPLIEEGDYITPRLIALEALPKDLENPDRPYTCEAEALLRKASEDNGVILRGHTENVRNAVYSPDNKLIASASGDMTIRLWDAKTGKCLNTFEGYYDPIAFSPDGKLLSSSSADMTIYIWNVSTGTIFSTLKGHNDVVNSAAFSPDGLLLVTGSEDNTIRIWDVKTGELLRIIEGHRERVNSVSYSFDGLYIVSASKDKTIKIWDSETGRCVMTLIGHTNSVDSAVFCPNNQSIFSYSWDGTARFWNSKTGECFKIFRENTEGYNFCKAVLSPSGRYMAAISETIIIKKATNTTPEMSQEIDILKIWDISTGMSIRELGEIEFNSDISFSPDEKFIAISQYDHLIRIIETDEKKHYLSLSGHGGVVNSVTFSYDGKLLLSSSFDQTVRLWDAESGICLMTTNDPKEGYTSALFSPDAKHFVTISTDQSKKSIIRIWETNTGKSTRTLQGQPGGVFYANYSFDGKTIISASYISASYDTNIRYWDAETGECLKSVNDYFINPSQISPNDKYLVAVPDNSRNSIELWDLEKRERLYSIVDGHKDQILAIAFSPDSKYIATGSGDGTTKIWSVESGKHIKTLTNLLYAIRSLAFSPDGKRIAVASGHRDIAIFDFPPLQQLITEAQNLLKEREFTPDEKELYYLE